MQYPILVRENFSKEISNFSHNNISVSKKEVDMIPSLLQKDAPSNSTFSDDTSSSFL